MNRWELLSEDHPAYSTLIFINVISTTFLAVMSAVATIIADVSIQGELALSTTQSIWITTLYLLGVNTTVPTATWFANYYGHRRVYAYGVLLFTFGSILVGFSDHFLLLAIARVIEGIGAGLVFPVGLGLMVQNLPKERIALGLNLYIVGAFGCGLGIGIPLSGYLTQFESWRSIFYLVALIGSIATFFCWPPKQQVASSLRYPFDFWGFFFFATFIATLLIALTLGPIKSTDEGWRSPFILGLFFVAAISLIATIYVERKHPNPLIPLVLFKDPIFATSSAAMFLLGMSLFASVTVSIQYMINALEYEKFATGKIASIYGIAMASFGIIASQIIKIIPVPILTFVGLSLLVFSYFLNNELSWMTGVDQVALILLIRGMGIGLALGPTTLLALYGVPSELKNAAATLLTFFRQVGGTYGGTLIAIFSIRQTIFHAARFGEQANNQLPAYKMTIQNLTNKFPDPAQAKAAVVKNILTQAYIQGQNDALIVFGYVTGFVAIVLMGLLSYRAWKAKETQ